MFVNLFQFETETAVERSAKKGVCYSVAQVIVCCTTDLLSALSRVSLNYRKRFSAINIRRDQRRGLWIKSYL